MDPYRELGVQKDATTAEISRAYRRMTKPVHPDAPGGGNRETFERLTKARDILLDPEARKRFDETGDASITPPDQTDNEALGIIGMLLGHVLTQQHDVTRENLARLIERTLDEKRAEVTMFIDMGATALRRIEKIKGRFKRLTKGDNLLDGSLAWHESTLKKAAEANKKKRETIDRAIAIIKEYDFSPEAAAGWISGPSASTSNATTGGFGFNPLRGF